MTASNAVHAVALAIDALVAEPELGPVLGDELVEINRLITRLEAIKLRKLGRFERDGGPAADGALSTVAWLRHRCRMSPSAASAVVRSARILPALHQCRDEFEAGEISAAHVNVITQCADTVGLDRFGEGEKILVELARQTDPKNLSWAGRYLRNVLDPDGAYEDYERNHDRRRVFLSQMLDGMFVLQGQLDQEAGAILVTALEALMPPPAPDDHRTAPQRRADALAELARLRLDSASCPPVAARSRTW